VLTVPPGSSNIEGMLNNKEIAEIILDIIQKQSFANWYESEFEDYITGEDESITKEQIVSQLESFVERVRV
jgi:hypothetical protein